MSDPWCAEIYDDLGREVVNKVSAGFVHAWMRAEVCDHVSSIGLYYKSEDGRYYFVWASDAIQDLVYELWVKSAGEGERWTEMTWKLNSDGELEVDFRYDELVNGALEGGGRPKEWIRENLGDVEVIYPSISED